MIQLTCANCKNGLEVDDAFAGGVCRCQYCGTIQTVPKPGARPRTPGAAVRQAVGAAEEPKALYQVKSRSGLSSAPSGLEELAEVVHSSGLSSGLAHRTTRNITTATPAQQKASNRTTLIAFLSGFGVVAILVIIGAIVVFGRGKTGGTESNDGGLVANLPTTPSFLQTDLESDKVVYVIDRGDATAHYFPVIKRITGRSVRSLGDDRKFAVILWNNGSTDTYPRISGSAYASEEEAGRLSAWFDEVSTGRATNVDSAIAEAVEQNPGEIVLLTAKSDQLEGSDFADVVLNAVKGKSIKIHTVSLGDSPPGDPLKKIALETKGKFTHLTRPQLSELSNP